MAGSKLSERELNEICRELTNIKIGAENAHNCMRLNPPDVIEAKEIVSKGLRKSLAALEAKGF